MVSSNDNNRNGKINSNNKSVNSGKSNDNIKHAAALKYEPGKMSAPKIVAAGRGEAAENILKTAVEHDIPVYKDENLAMTLSKMELGSEIPPDLYKLVAEILVFICDIDRKLGEDNAGNKSV